MCVALPCYCWVGLDPFLGTARSVWLYPHPAKRNTSQTEKSKIKRARVQDVAYSEHTPREAFVVVHRANSAVSSKQN